MKTELRTTILALVPGILALAVAACSSDDTTKPKTTTGTAGATGSTGSAGTSSTLSAGSTSSTTSTTSGGSGGAGSTTTAAGSGGSAATGAGGGTTTTAAGGAGGAGTGGAGGAGTGTPGMACGSASIPVANALVSNFDGTMDMGLGSSAVSPGSRWGVSMSTGSTAILAAEASGDAAQGNAAHFHGMTGTNANVDYADMETTFSGTVVAMKPSGINASAYRGVSFKLKAGPTNTATTVKVKLHNDDSIPACAICTTDCFGGYVFSAVVPVGGTFGTIMVPFDQVLPETFGTHTRTKVDPAGIITMAIIVLPSNTYDLWVDDVTFY